MLPSATELDPGGNQPVEIVLDVSEPEAGNESDGSIFDAEDGFSTGEDEDVHPPGRGRSRAVDDGRRHSSRIADRRHVGREDDELSQHRPHGAMTREQQREERVSIVSYLRLLLGW